jgi:hypothetical protein
MALSLTLVLWQHAREMVCGGGYRVLLLARLLVVAIHGGNGEAAGAVVGWA